MQNGVAEILLRTWDPTAPGRLCGVAGWGTDCRGREDCRREEVGDFKMQPVSEEPEVTQGSLGGPGLRLERKLGCPGGQGEQRRAAALIARFFIIATSRLISLPPRPAEAPHLRPGRRARQTGKVPSWRSSPSLGVLAPRLRGVQRPAGERGRSQLCGPRRWRGSAPSLRLRLRILPIG